MFLGSTVDSDIHEYIDLDFVYETSDGKTFARVGPSYAFTLFEDIKPYRWVQTYTDNVELPCTRN